jgi:hypothetical protein
VRANTVTATPDRADKVPSAAGSVVGCGVSRIFVCQLAQSFGVRCQCGARVGTFYLNEASFGHITDTPDIGIRGLQRLGDADLPPRSF